jgi:heavy metal translocating P-type ATPase
MTLLENNQTTLETRLPTCSLCNLALPFHPIKDGEKAFCCSGCHAVFNILTTKNQLVNFQDHPIFQQAVRSGLISNPALLEEIRRKQPEMHANEMQKLYFEIADMWCPACSELIKLILLQEKGVKNCVIDYATDLACVEFSPRYTSKEKIYQLIQSLGYQVSTLDEAKKAVSFSLYLRFAVAAFCSLNVMMFAYPLYATYFDFDDQGYGQLFAWISLLTSLPVVTYSFWPILRHFWTSCRVGLYGMETLVVIGVATAFGLSLYDLFQGGTRVYFDSMTVIIAFMLLGKIIETRAKFSAKDSLLRLARALPRRGRKRFPDNSQQFVPIKEIHLGDTVVAVSGEKIVLDGVIVEGECYCDESLMTGESLPIRKRIGDALVGGSIIQSGTIAFRVTANAEQSTLQRILDMVQQEIGRKTTYIRSADSIAQWFIPLVLGIAFFTAFVCCLFGIVDAGKTVVETALIRAVSVLLISCPCAIGIAAPLAESHVLNALANLGAIVRNRGCLALLGKETAFVFDKTGTVTEGRFTVLSGLEAIPLSLRRAVKGLSAHSSHPIACAINLAIEEGSGNLHEIEEFAGKGLKGIFEGQKLLLGSADFLMENGVSIPSLEKKSFSIVSYSYVSYGKDLITVISLGDRIREGAQSMIAGLKPLKTYLLSGDAEDSVSQVGRELGFKDWKAKCSPLQKKQYIDGLRQKGEIVCMFGDGINDAPSLSAADIGISVVSATDISIQVSDVLLTTDRLEVISKMRKLASVGRKIVKQNLFWAFFYNCVGVGLAALGWLSPIFAACAMVMSSLMVIFNAKRIG